MRLKCEVQITHRDVPGFNIRKSGRAAFAQVSLGRKPGDKKDGPVFLMLCTAQNRSGTKYFLQKNVEQIFSKFVSEGKATVRFLSPLDDIAFSKADPNQLAIFIKLIKLACMGKEFPEKGLSTLVPASTKQVEKPPAILRVSRPSEYPMTLPKSLSHVEINNCSLRRISPQILSLTELKSLDLSGNSITSIPDSLGQLKKLHTLNCSYNALKVFSLVMCNTSLANSLVSLDLRNNQIKGLPAEIVKLQYLYTLNLSNNEIRYIPESMAALKNLRQIFMSDNRLQYLPGTLLPKSFDTVDFSSNPFQNQLPPVLRDKKKFDVPSLAECAARVIVIHKIPYTKEDLDYISIDYLRKVHHCPCGKPCFESGCPRLFKTHMPSCNNYSHEELPFLVYFCSKTCLSNYRL